MSNRPDRDIIVRNSPLGAVGSQVWLLLAGSSALMAAAIFALAGRPALMNDSLWPLVWAGQIVNGEAPAFDDPESPTPHPLPNAIAVVLRLAGWWPAYWAFAALGLLLYGAVVALTCALGRACFSTAVGVVAAVFVAVIPVLLDLGTFGHMDLAFIALVLLAVYMEIRGVGAPAVMGVLAIAGLVRPEAWLFAGIYWLWCARRGGQRLSLLALVGAAAPTLWILIDAAITGDPLHSLTHTQEGARRLGRTTGIESVPRLAGNGLRSQLTDPVLLGGCVGFVAAALTVPRSRPLLAAGLLAGATYVAQGLANVSLLPRYLALPAVVLAITFAFALLGWRDQHDRTIRRRWAVAAAGLAALTVLGLPDRVGDVRSLLDKTRSNASLVDKLHDMASDERAKRLLARCDAILVRDSRPRALVSGVLSWRIERVQNGRNAAQTRDAAFVTVADQAVERYVLFHTRERIPPPAERPAGHRVVYRHGAWEISTSSSCR